MLLPQLKLRLSERDVNIRHECKVHESTQQRSCFGNSCPSDWQRTFAASIPLANSSTVRELSCGCVASHKLRHTYTGSLLQLICYMCSKALLCFWSNAL